MTADSVTMHCSSLVMVLGHAVIDRDCWPVTDKKDEMKFRKKCGNWLEQIIHVSVLVSYVIQVWFMPLY